MKLSLHIRLYALQYVSTAISACMKKAIINKYKNPRMKSSHDKTLTLVHKVF